MVLLTACDGGSSAAGPTTAVRTTTPRSASSSAPTTTPPPGLAGVATDPHAGLRGRLLQFRRDAEDRRVQVRVTAANSGLHVQSLELATPGLTADPADPRDAQLHAGAALDLPVQLGPPDCTVDAGPPVARVGLHDDTGALRTVTLPLDDGGLVGRLHEEECAEQALFAQVGIEVTDVQPEQLAKGPGLRAVIRIRRLTGTDPVRVTGTGSNTVYDITAAGPLPTLDGGGEVTVDLDLLPARCDVHALGESYRTGLIGLEVALGSDHPRLLTLAPPDPLRRRIESFAVETCRGR